MRVRTAILERKCCRAYSPQYSSAAGGKRTNLKKIFPYGFGASLEFSRELHFFFIPPVSQAGMFEGKI